MRILRGIEYVYWIGMTAALLLLPFALPGCASGTQGSFKGPLCLGQPVALDFNDRTDRQEGIAAGCRRTHPDGTVDEVWITTGPKQTTPVAEVDQDVLGLMIEAAFAAGRRAGAP